MADFAVFPHNVYFIFRWTKLATLSFFLSNLILSIALRCIALFHWYSVYLLHAVVAIDIKHHLVDINCLAFRGYNAHAQRGIIKGTAEVFLAFL